LAVLGCCLIIYLIGENLGVSAGRDQVTAREHYEKAKKSALDACVDTEPAALTQCVTKAIETAQEQSDSRQDLYAQRDMGRWAFWLLTLTGATLGVTTVGVVLVKRTLDANLEVVSDSRKVTKAMDKQNELVARAQRPWLNFDLEVVSVHLPDYSLSVFPPDASEPPVYATVYVRVHVMNHTDFPAHEVRAEGQGHLESSGLFSIYTNQDDRETVRHKFLNVGKYGTGSAVFPNQPEMVTAFASIADTRREGMSIKHMFTKLTIGIRYTFEGGTGMTFREFFLYGVEEALTRTVDTDLLGSAALTTVNISVRADEDKTLAT